jgi:hypothetical protein
MENLINRAYSFLLKYWNTILAATSLAGVAIFSLVPPIQKYTNLFIFLAANAVVWTLIEIKVQLTRRERPDRTYSNMRVARPYIIEDIERSLRRSTQAAPLKLALLGGRIRSMSDVVRELVDDLHKGKTHGHIELDLYCIDPDYISKRTLPGDIDRESQMLRNASYGDIIRSISAELLRRGGPIGASSSLTINVTYYREDPHCYAYIIGDSIIYWGTYIWSSVTSDFIGPENPCNVINSADPQFLAVRDWISSRIDLFRREAWSTDST